ncbi:hypothetical protein JT358_04395 [Micrococcales bacterium 31B]|nr:hypothetical protein [Micrococcales bacterium 31B]
MTYLMLMRHAKAEPYNSTDKHRKLLPKGHEQSAQSGAFITGYCRGSDRSVDVAIVSSAARAQETFAHSKVRARHVVNSEVLYMTTPCAMLDEINDQLCALNLDDVRSVLVVAHEPAISALAYYLGHTPAPKGFDLAAAPELMAIDQEYASDPIVHVQHGVPTGTVCVLQYDAAALEDGDRAPTGAAAEGSCDLLEVYSPR